jgi:tetratricopeptide (TPR) repeat protein
VPVRSTLDPAAIAERAAEKLKGTAARKVQPKETFAAYETAETVSTPSAAAAQAYYGQGSHHFWRGDYSAALEQFRSAVAADDHDARFWYFKGLTEQRLSLNQQALDSLATGAKLEIQGYPGRAILYRSLERVQGAERLALKEAVLKAQLVRESPPAQPTSRIAQSLP